MYLFITVWLIVKLILTIFIQVSKLFKFNCSLFYHFQNRVSTTSYTQLIPLLKLMTFFEDNLAACINFN